jgi:putative DNA primase/helicase
MPMTPKEVEQCIAFAKAHYSDEARASLPGIGEDSDVVLLDPRDPMATARALVAARFTSGHRLLQHHRGAFWLAQTNYYALAADETLRTAAWTFMESAKRIVDKKSVPFKPGSAAVSNVLDALAAACHLDGGVDPPAWLAEADKHPPAAEMFPVANGLLHLPSGELHPSSPSYFSLTASPVTFDPDAGEPVHWLTFLGQLFGDDRETHDTLQDWFGYALAPDTSQQKIFMVVGPRRGGKGTIARILTALLGRDSVIAPTLSGLQSNFGLAPLIAKSLAIISDARVGGKSDQAVIAERLLSISGEDSITIDRKFMPAWTGRLPVRFMVLTNELPRIADNSNALAGRFIVLLLQHSFYGREDLGLADRLAAETTGILNWALVGYRRLRGRGYFIQPASATQAVEELEALGSPIKAYIRERCSVGPGKSIQVELLYQDWRAWCDVHGREKPGTSQAFGAALRTAEPGLRTSNRRTGDGRSRHYEGIALRSRSEDEARWD